MNLFFKILFGLCLIFSVNVFAKEKLGSAEEGKKAAAVLNEIFRAYGSGDVNFIRDHVDSRMIGYQKMLDDIVLEANQCKQLRVNLKDTQIQAGPDIVVIQTNWEKRCLQLPGMTPRLFSGHSTFLFQSGAGGWIINGISGNSPLAPSLPAGRF